jgi:diguanylate cyclase (GGDEF)-like protein/PAS domain S-box-containing protein
MRLTDSRSRSLLQSNLDAIVGDGEVFEAAFMLAADGRVEALGLPQKHRQAATELRGADFSNNSLFKLAIAAKQTANSVPLIWSDKYLSALSGKHTVGIALSAGDRVLIGEASLDRILSLVGNIGSNNIVFVIDKQGQLLASSRPDPDGRFENFATMPFFQAVISKRPLPLFENYHGQVFLVGGSLSSKLGWVIASVAPAGMRNASYRATVILVVAGLLAALLLSLTLGPLWASRMARPIKVLMARTRNFIRGDSHSPWPAQGSIIEFNQLSLDIGHMVEVIQKRETESALSQEQLRATLENTPLVAVQWYDVNGRVLYWNSASESLYGFARTEVVGTLITEQVHRDKEQVQALLSVLKEIERTGKPFGPAELASRRKDGTDIFVLATTFPIPSGEASWIYVCMDIDITERKRAEERVEELAFSDPLTRLPNRALLLDRLKQTMSACSRGGNYGALLFIDLDNFKTLNDTLGHDLGDSLLKDVAKRLLLCVREGDTVARLGGDEFMVVLASLSRNQIEAANEVEGVAAKILNTLGQPYSLGDISYRSTASIGITLLNGEESSSEELMKQADLAMYQSKEAGRNTWHFFDPLMEFRVKERAALEEDLRRGIEQQQLLLHFQAQVLETGCVTGAEVLVRWQHPLRGVVSPAEFIPLAENTGLILPLGLWVLQSACKQLALWASQAERAHLTISVNVSAHQFRDAGFVDEVRTVLKSTGANPQRLKLELTESLLVADVDEVIEKMLALKAEGVSFSLDDFGTGYSSLSYLKRLPIDQLKIDQSFVRDLLTDPNDAAIAKTIVALANSLGLGVIAEGVETQSQRDFLASLGCNAYQGYYFCHPLPINFFEEFLHKGVIPKKAGAIGHDSDLEY